MISTSAWSVAIEPLERTRTQSAGSPKVKVDIHKGMSTWTYACIVRVTTSKVTHMPPHLVSYVQPLVQLSSGGSPYSTVEGTPLPCGGPRPMSAKACMRASFVTLCFCWLLPNAMLSRTQTV
jgi:hypothetical protein